MKATKWFVLGMALVMLTVAPGVLAEETKEKPAKENATVKEKPTKDALKGEWAILISECRLSDQQQADLKAQVKAKEEALAAWEMANGEKLKAAQDAAKKAKEGADKDAIKKAAEELKAIGADLAKATADADAAIYAILTPDQKATWEDFRLYRTMMGRYKKCNLTEEQTGKVKAACAAASKEMADVKGDDKAAKKAKDELSKELQKTIEDTILTAEQRESLVKKPATSEKKPAGDQKPAAEEKKPEAAK